MGFVKFTETARSYKPKASVRTNGTIGLNSGALAKFELRNYSYAVLYYDQDRKIVGVRPTTSEEEGAIKLNRGRTGAWIAARRFLDYFGIATNKTKKCDATWDEKEKMIVFEV